MATVGTLLGGFMLATSAQAATNLALGRTTAVSSTETSSLGGANAVDGSTSTRWASAEGSDPQWIRVDLGSVQQIGQVTLRWEAAYGKAYRIEVSPTRAPGPPSTRPPPETAASTTSPA
ncbi:discoidin domain-containing protein [Catellatospora bangladeshensis]|uniref:discoidin domain-containing protein n=1 Tax=Catellatospora bangladeshensis TaxID=310355 RepID=UPI003614CE88